MTDNRKFIADVRKFADKTADQMLRVAKQSIQDTVRYAQKTAAQGGNMPVDTGFLRNSLVVSVSGTERAKGKPEAGKDSETGNESVILGLSSMELGDPFQVAWVAEYALRQHYGFVGNDKLGRTYNQGGYLWRDKAAQLWPITVARNARKVQ